MNLTDMFFGAAVGIFALLFMREIWRMMKEHRSSRD